METALPTRTLAFFKSIYSRRLIKNFNLTRQELRNAVSYGLAGGLGIVEDETHCDQYALRGS
jgi:hypothetical protein